jgi:hypothetical protein
MGSRGATTAIRGDAWWREAGGPVAILALAMRLVATCPEEAKPVLVRELEALGATNLVPAFRGVVFDADDALFYRLHLQWIRCAAAARSRSRPR